MAFVVVGKPEEIAVKRQFLHFRSTATKKQPEASHFPVGGGRAKVY